MQDIHSMGSGGGSGRLFGNLGDRRLRPHSHHLNHQQTLKCPRCDSLNTKFCYYNNYNLSQPRHFCKGCRRYWTKGGVLRNVPVGGGCRKAKRSSKTKQNPSDDAPADAAPPPPHKSNSNSSSDSSSLTATAVATEAVSGGGGGSSNSAPDLFNFHNNSKLFVSQAVNPSFNPPLIDHQSNDVGSIFPEIGVFTSMMTSSNDPSPLGFNMADISSYRLENQNQEQFVENRSSDQQMMTNTAGYLDQTGEIELSGLQSRTSNGGLAGVDWQQADGGDQDQDQGMFDLTGTVDQGYWSQTQWPDHSNHSLHYLP